MTATTSEICAICLDKITPVVACAHGHYLHVSCAMDMREGMGRDTCPQCATPFVMPPLPPPPLLCILEHGLHLAIAFSWLPFIWAHPRDGELKQDAWRHIQMTRNTLRSRVTVLDDKSSDLTMIRANTAQILTCWAVLRYAVINYGPFIVEVWLPKFYKLHIGAFQNFTQTTLDLQFTHAKPCKLNPEEVCVYTMNSTETVAQAFDNVKVLVMVLAQNIYQSFVF